MKNCIYRIINTQNNKVYIGSTIDSERRKLEHFSQLEKEVHINSYLQRSYNKYGKNSFVFDVIESDLRDEELVKKEQHYINLFNSSNSNFGYNISAYADRPDGRKYTKVFTIKLRDIIKSKSISNSAIALMTYLQTILENYTNRIIMENGRDIKNKDIVENFGISRQHVHALLNELEDNNIIKRIGDTKARKIYMNPYIITVGTEIQQEIYNMFNQYKTEDDIY